MGTTRIKLYNDALLICGERSLVSLSEERKPRRLLDQVWDSQGVRYCLEQGQWQFAMRTQQIEYDPDIEPDFGYQHAFDKPDDWVSTSAVCSDPYFREPLLNYIDELEYWWSDVTPIYVRFVSDDDDYGGDLSRWPASFCDYAATYFASRILLDLTSDKGKQDAVLHPRTGLLAVRLRLAKSRAAMTQPTRFPPAGSWVRARGNRPRGDRGNSGSLIG